jgi:LCP family protein required for cell wall assembly
MSRKRIAILIAILAGLVLICACGGVFAYYAMNTPLSPALSLTEQPQIVLQPIYTEESQSPQQNFPTNTQLPQLSNCGQTGSINYLIMGTDAPSGFGLNGPLAIRIVRIDFRNKTVLVFSIPRDLWVPVSGLEVYGVQQARLWEAFQISRINAGYSVSMATNLFAQILLTDFGIRTDHYIVGKMMTLANIIDTVGGITVQISTPYDGTRFGYHYFPAGPYYMNGLLALEYAIARSSSGQWTGVDRQTQVLQALYQKIFSPAVIPQVPALIPQFLNSVTTDLSVQQIMDLICISQMISPEKISYAGIGLDFVTEGTDGILYPNLDLIQKEIVRLFQPSE